LITMLNSFSRRLRSTGFFRWYQQKGQADRLILILLSAVIAVFFVFMAIWSPVSNWNEAQKIKLSDAKEELRWIKSNTVAAKRLSGQSASNNSRSPILQAITGTASRQKLRLSRVQPESDAAVSVTIERQSFNRIITWLASLGSEQRVGISRITITSEGAGLVNAQIRLER